MVLTETQLAGLIAQAFIRHGMSAPNAALVAATVAAAERDGAASHGLLRVDGYISSMQSGWADGAAIPVVSRTAPAVLMVDGGNGFAQVALEAARPLALQVVREMGLAAICIHDAHHFAALWPDVEPFAEAGLLALSTVASRSRILVWGGTRRVLGTNPIAFACPQADGPPIVWDMATSTKAQGEVLLARKAGQQVPPGIGVDAAGNPSTDPAAILDGGALLAFGGAKGSNIAFMVEILAAALTGGQFGFEDEAGQVPGALTSRTGQFLLLIDPARSGGGFAGRVGELVRMLRDAGSDRLPGDARHRHRAQSLAHGIIVPQDAHDRLIGLAAD